MNKIVIALGGNALGKTPIEQLELVKNTAKQIVEIVKEGNEETEKTLALKAAITSPKVKEYIEENYGSAVICVFD